MAKRKAAPEEETVEVNPDTGMTPEQEEERKIKFEQVPQDPFEIEVEEEGEEEKEVEAPEKPKDESSSATMKAFDALIDKIEKIQVGNSPQPTQLPTREPEESEEEFAKRFNEEVFKEDPHGMASKLVDRKTRKILEEQVAPLLGSILEDAYENQIFRLKNDSEEGEVFRMLEEDVLKILKTLPPGQQKNPQILKRVYENVKASNVNQIVDLKIKKALEGKKEPEKSNSSRRAPLTEGGSSLVPSNGGAKTIRLPASELAALQNQALRSGVDISVLLERRKAR
jgi:hypothetical protein